LNTKIKILFFLKCFKRKTKIKLKKKKGKRKQRKENRKKKKEQKNPTRSALMGRPTPPAGCPARCKRRPGRSIGITTRSARCPMRVATDPDQAHKGPPLSPHAMEQIKPPRPATPDMPWPAPLHPINSSTGHHRTQGYFVCGHQVVWHRLIGAFLGCNHIAVPQVDGFNY
jgi:hypothetical protein